MTAQKISKATFDICWDTVWSKSHTTKRLSCSQNL